MKAFEIHDQVRLPFTRCVSIVVSGIQFRLFRAAITVSIVALAVAFLMTILSDSLIGKNVASNVEKQIGPRRTFLFWVDRISSPMTSGELSSLLRNSEEGGSRWQELKQWGDCNSAELEVLAEFAEREETYLRFFRGLSEGDRRPLVGRVSGRKIFQRLAQHGEFDEFVKKTRDMGIKIPGNAEKFKEFLDDWEKTRSLRESIMDGHMNAVSKLEEQTSQANVQELLATLDSEEIDMLESLGFRVDESDIPILREEAKASLDAETILFALNNSSFKQKFALKQGIDDLNQVTSEVLLEFLASRSAARWYKKTVEEIEIPSEFSVGRIVAVARKHIKDSSLAEIESGIDAEMAEGSTFGFSNRVMWLIVVSMIVCVVGIANAMLMSVTERFNEIATMKCLGATDGFIMLNFILESGLQGFFGGIAGALAGLFLGTLRASLGYGFMAIQNIPIAAVLAGMGIAIASGVIISVIAAIYPAFVAARLAPMEAMRVE